jgi:Tol biopolymer transport system component
MIGTKLAHYEITSHLGSGGMGDVYQATDAKLGRSVAIKFLPETFSHDADRVARFQREARVLASLNHSNIAAIHGLEEISGHHFLVMELVPGETLAQKIEHGPLSLDVALDIAHQIADALESAHERGIIHRDLKPANIKITPEGKVKVLDFGLARAYEGETSNSSLSNSPTLSMAATNPGIILGTAGYMSPEQAKGRAVDKRADIWAFGVVLYELLTGRSLFGGEDVGEVLAAVIKDEPKWDGVPRKIQKLLKSCLEKDPRKRLRDIGDAWRCLEEPVQAENRHSRTPWVVATAAFAIIAIVLGGLAWRAPSPGRLETTSFEIVPPEKGTIDWFELSPDGRYLAMDVTQGGQRKVWIRPLDSTEARVLPGTENVFLPFWSPDSAYIAFSTSDGIGKLKKAAVTGGPPQTLCDIGRFGGGTWNSDGVIVFSDGGALYRVADGGGTKSQLTEPSSGGIELHLYPEFLPDRRHFLYTQAGAKPETDGIHMASLGGGPPVRLLSDVSNALYSPPNGRGQNGHLLFRREETLMAQPFDPDRLHLIGDAFPIAEGIGDSLNTGLTRIGRELAHMAASVSANGTLAYGTGFRSVGRQLVWMDRNGKFLGLIGKPGNITWESLSPDEKNVSFGLINVSEISDIWLYELSQGTTSRFTFGPGLNNEAVWSPDSARIIYKSTPKTIATAGDIYQKSAIGAGKEDLLLRVGRDLRILDWSRDGKFLLYIPDIGDPKTGADLWLLPLEGDKKPMPFLATRFRETNGQFSPDGKWIAYRSDESGQDQVYVQPVPATGAKFQISTAGGGRPRWRRDGKELFYVSADGKLMAMPIKLSATIERGVPQPLFDFPIPDSFGVHQFYYQPTGDGQRFLMNIPASQEGSTANLVKMILNWQTGLKR